MITFVCMNLKKNLIWLLFLIPVIFLIWYYVNKREDAPLRFLPYFGPKATIKVNDTSYHTIGSFSFLNQNNKTVTNETIKNKVFVTDFFFTTCKSICPIMNTQLVRVYKEFKSNSDFLILSHTVDPETDSVPQLALHAKKYDVTDECWHFLTGSKVDLYNMARKSYLLNAEEGNGGEEDFIHTQNFALVDKEGHIRGFYDGTDSIEVSRLITDIKVLFKEYEFKSKMAP